MSIDDIENKPAIIDPSSLPAIFQENIQKAKDYAELGISKNTRRAYRADWAHFEIWCQERNLLTLPADSSTLVLYLSDIADKFKVSTLQRRLVAINKMHRAFKYKAPGQDESVKAVWRGIRRKHGIFKKGKAPLMVDDIRNMVHSILPSKKGLRDIAIILIGFCGAFRRSELVSINYQDLDFQAEGLIIHIRRSKTDQEGMGRKIGIPYGNSESTCPVRCLQSWLRNAAIDNGPIWRPVEKGGGIKSTRLTDKSVSNIIKRVTKQIGLNPDIYSGHSLRSGFATSAAISGANERSIMEQTGHKSTTMVRSYIRDGRIFRDNAASKLGI